MDAERWLLFCATETVLCFTPGVAVMLVIGTALAGGARDGVRASLGILAANAAYFALSATGLGVLLVASKDAFALVKWVGAAYLVAIGAQALRGAIARSGSPRAAGAAAPRRRRAFLRGFATQAANPKTLLFFVAILPQFIDPEGALATQLVILGGTSISIEFAMLALYAGAAGRAQGFARSARWAAAVDALGGGLLVFAGLGLALLRP